MKQTFNQSISVLLVAFKHCQYGFNTMAGWSTHNCEQLAGHTCRYSGQSRPPTVLQYKLPQVSAPCKPVQQLSGLVLCRAEMQDICTHGGLINHAPSLTHDHTSQPLHGSLSRQMGASLGLTVLS